MKRNTVMMLTFGMTLLAGLELYATPIPVSETSTAVANSYSTPSLSIKSSVTADGSDYLYTYVVTSTDAGEPTLDAFTVKKGNWAGIFAITATGGFTGAVSDGVLSYDTPTIIGNVTGTETYSFESPYLPVQGTTYEQDSFSFGPSAAYVPGTSLPVPDGGLTVALLGGAMTAMTLIRRKLA
jgi:hypothetical protein